MPRSTKDKPSLGDLTDDDLRCAYRMSDMLLSLPSEGYADNALIWSFNMVFSELVHHCGGSDAAVLSWKEVFLQYFQIEQDDATNCYRRLEEMIAALRAEGFTDLSIVSCLLAEIRNIYEDLGFGERIIKKCTAEMIERLYACQDFSTDK